MEQPAINEQVVRKYLLGDLAEAERERIEERLLTDDDFYENLTALEDEVEDELIDQYLDGELTRPQREHFEIVFLNSPERADKLRLVKDLRGRVIPGATPTVAPARPARRSWIPAFDLFQNPLVGLSCAAALLIAALSCAWLWTKSRRLETELRQAQAGAPQSPQVEPRLREELEQLRLRNEELTAGLRRSEEQRAGLEQDVAALKGREEPAATPPGRTSPPSPSSLASVVLLPFTRGPSAGTAPPALALRPGVTQARLFLNIPRDVDPKSYKSFRALVRKRSGEEIWRAEAVQMQTASRPARAVITLPAERLAEGEYVAELKGLPSEGPAENIGSYYFRVPTKKP